MDLIPIVPAGRQVIESYGPAGFRISGLAYETSVLVFPDRTLVWNVASFADITESSLRPVVEPGGIEILLLGCGRAMRPVPMALRQALKAAGIGVDAMDTGAACRTFDVLMGEDRRVVAALIKPV
jgi:uncharacterized protein